MSSSTERFNAYGETPLDDFKVGGKPSKRNASRKKTSLENTYPIDETEQDQIISELFQDAERLAKKGRRSFHYLFLFIAGIYGATLLYSLRYHMEMEHQRFFRNTVQEWGFQSFYVASAVCYISSAIFVKHGFQKKSFITNIPFLVSFFIGILSALLWMFLILGMDDPISVLGNYFWMPFANILGLMLACYVDRDAINLLRDAKQIENVKYTFKDI